MAVKGEKMILAAPQFLHAGHAFDNKPHLAAIGGVQAIELIHEVIDTPRLFYLDNLARLFLVRLFIKFFENLG